MTSGRPHASGSYLKTKVMTASPPELRLLLLDGAIRFAEKGRQGIADTDHEAVFEGISRSQDILMELINGLRPEHDPELCKRLSGLYTFLYTRLIDAHQRQDVAIVDEVIRLLRYERETWQLLIDKLADENAAARTITSLPDAAPHATAAPGPTASLGRGTPAGGGGRTADLVGGRISVEG